jgi:phenylacetate-CoA ligase
MGFPTYFEAMDYPRIIAEYPQREAFVEKVARISRDELRAIQNRRFLNVVRRGWEIPFYHRRWRAVGLEPADVRSLEDITKLPVFSKSDLIDSIERHPPFGDFTGMDSFHPDERPPVVMATTSGTTGRPQPLFFGPRSREIHNLITARAYYLHGLRSDDVVHSLYGHGMINGGHHEREVFLHFTNCVFLSAGTGIETRSKRQIELMRDFGVTVLVGFVDYVRHLAAVAEEAGIVPGRDIKMRMISTHLGAEKREKIAELWGGAEVYEWYGLADVGTVAAEGPDRDGLYVMEDAIYLEIIDPDTAAGVVDGERGAMCVTALYKDDFHPVIRFNTNDVSAFHTTPSSLGWTLRRNRGFLGRADNMIKLRGINVFPTAIGALLEDLPGVTGEYLLRVGRVGDRDELKVLVESRIDVAQYAAFSARLEEEIRSRIGVRVVVEPVAAGALADLTGLETRQKAIRLIDDRPA